jgi:hypothetical protein
MLPPVSGILSWESATGMRYAKVQPECALLESLRKNSGACRLLRIVLIKTSSRDDISMITYRILEYHQILSWAHWLEASWQNINIATLRPSVLSSLKFSRRAFRMVG